MNLKNIQKASELISDIESCQEKLQNTDQFLTAISSEDYEIKPFYIRVSLKAYLQLPYTYTFDLARLSPEDKAKVTDILIKYLEKDITDCKGKIDEMNIQLSQL